MMMMSRFVLLYYYLATASLLLLRPSMAINAAVISNRAALGVTLNADLGLKTGLATHGAQQQEFANGLASKLLGTKLGVLGKDKVSSVHSNTLDADLRSRVNAGSAIVNDAHAVGAGGFGNAASDIQTRTQGANVFDREQTADITRNTDVKVKHGNAALGVTEEHQIPHAIALAGYGALPPHREHLSPIDSHRSLPVHGNSFHGGKSDEFAAKRGFERRDDEHENSLEKNNKHSGHERGLTAVDEDKTVAIGPGRQAAGATRGYSEASKDRASNVENDATMTKHSKTDAEKGIISELKRSSSGVGSTFGDFGIGPSSVGRDSELEEVDKRLVKNSGDTKSQRKESNSVKVFDERTTKQESADDAEIIH